ncbi:MAG: hypothetical protein R3F11_29700 [Verrucomicrobiales bacterium]
MAADLEFLVGDLAEAGCEVRLMRGSSIRHNPGAMWRFLALSDRGRLVTVVDSDRGPLVELEITRTEAMARAGLNFWRVPVFSDYDKDGRMGYRPILACQFGSAQSLPMAKLLKAHVWHRLRGTLPTTCKMPGCGEPEITGTRWPNYGYDEWFLLSAVYPRVARRGVLTFVPAAAKARMLPLDIEYVTWANPRGEVFYFGNDASCCCEPVKTEPKSCLTAIEDYEISESVNLTQKHRVPAWAARSKVSQSSL